MRVFRRADRPVRPCHRRSPGPAVRGFPPALPRARLPHGQAGGGDRLAAGSVQQAHHRPPHVAGGRCGGRRGRRTAARPGRRGAGERGRRPAHAEAASNTHAAMSSTRSVHRVGLPLRRAIGSIPCSIVVLSPASTPQPFGGSIDGPRRRGPTVPVDGRKARSRSYYRS